MFMEEDFLQLSGVQHFAYCPRQWALIHVENQWKDNGHTVLGELFHKTAHNEKNLEVRGSLIIQRGLRVFSAKLGLSGQCDVVEFYQSKEGINLYGQSGLWKPFPIEYKKGAAYHEDADEVQLICQCLCLEEMLCCTITQGALFYGEKKRRKTIEVTAEKRKNAMNIVESMHRCFKNGYTPKCKQSKRCNFCSLLDICVPELSRCHSVENYIEKHLKEEVHA